MSQTCSQLWRPPPGIHFACLNASGCSSVLFRADTRTIYSGGLCPYLTILLLRKKSEGKWAGICGTERWTQSQNFLCFCPVQQMTFKNSLIFPVASLAPRKGPSCLQQGHPLMKLRIALQSYSLGLFWCLNLSPWASQVFLLSIKP